MDVWTEPIQMRGNVLRKHQPRVICVVSCSRSHPKPRLGERIMLPGI